MICYTIMDFSGSSLFAMQGHGKPCFCIICEKKGADQLHGDRIAEQRLSFCYIVQSFYFLNPKFEASIFFVCTAQFVSDLVRNSEDRFSRDVAHMRSLNGES